MSDGPKGAWIFLSHSSKDWDQVRAIRNQLEERGHRPLMFFLKCVSEDEELHDLLKREVEARKWFVLCDSANARASRWVQQEQTLIESLPNKGYERIDLASPIEDQIQRVDRLCRRINVFISYARADADVARAIDSELSANEFDVWTDRQLTSGTDWQSEMQRAIEKACDRGFVLVLMSPLSMKSLWVECEVSYALDKAARAGGLIVPVLLEDVAQTKAAMSPEMGSQLDRLNWFDLSGPDRTQGIKRLAEDLARRELIF